MKYFFVHSFGRGFLLMMLVALPVLAAENQELERAKAHFRAGRIEEAITLLETLLATSTLSLSDRVEAWEFLAFCNVAKQNEARVQTSFAEILKLDATYEPRDSYLSHPAVMRSWLTARKQVLGNYWQMTDAGIKTLAILDFDNNSLSEADKVANLGKGLADLLITNLATLTKLKVVERERIQFILEEIQRSEATVQGQPLVNPDFAVRVGKLLGAQSVLIGSFMKLEKKLRIDVRLVKTETSEIIKTDFVEGPPDEVLDLAKKLALKVSENLDVAVNKVEEENLERLRHKEIPLEAAMAYSEALNMLDQGRYQEAQAMLTKTLKLAPSFKMAREKLSLLQTFQKS
ncbi:MAG: tetratricopeptide repeat protein [candidate division KSB1 bacterium]|nr:tetratricopeptide repeat protein [candidate division KSB1 bacterium]MDZ7273445.1 tetratricopeptide repeat protein [candidate division KSB1 bacterium]MDZ7286963.1 tetratricopeptide repeat protein [candidate division KSB1 bacterium]MDZ7299684.1 tetratricopeptide repeat protein [candidate division KSB1 bacterium]MDZ7307948.1 tetratricopeptide repeat protein [candidate division KSB1 bacterium]